MDRRFWILKFWYQILIQWPWEPKYDQFYKDYNILLMFLPPDWIWYFEMIIIWKYDNWIERFRKPKCDLFCTASNVFPIYRPPYWIRYSELWNYVIWFRFRYMAIFVHFLQFFQFFVKKWLTFYGFSRPENSEQLLSIIFPIFQFISFNPIQGLSILVNSFKRY